MNIMRQSCLMCQSCLGSMVTELTVTYRVGDMWTKRSINMDKYLKKSFAVTKSEDAESQRTESVVVAESDRRSELVSV